MILQFFVINYIREKIENIIINSKEYLTRKSINIV